MNLLKKMKEKIASVTWFDKTSFDSVAVNHYGVVAAYNEITIPFLQDIGFLTVPSDIDKLHYISRMDRVECFNYLRDDYLKRNGKGALNLRKYYEYIVANNFGYWGKDEKSVTYTDSLIKLPGGQHEDLCSLTFDEETQNNELHFDVEALRKRNTYKLEGEALNGYNRIQKLCEDIEELTDRGLPFVTNSLVYRDIDGHWKIQERLTYSQLVAAGK